MSQAARREIAIKRHWAVPGSRHDRLVRVMKFVLPILILGLLVVLIGVAAAALAVEIVRDRAFEHRSRGDTRHG